MIQINLSGLSRERGNGAVEKRVLIVDDEKPIRDAFTRILRKDGWEVRSAESGEEALEVMAKNPFMILFLDMNLPGMSGIELNRRIRDHWPMAITHAVTGYSSLFELTDCREAGFEDYFTKPLESDVLVKAATGAAEKLERWKGTARKSSGVFIPF